MSDSITIIQANTAGAASPDCAFNQVGTYYRELRQLLDRVERSTTHHQVLGVDRSATGEQIKLAYQKAVTVLNPPHPEARASMDEALLAKIDRAFDRLSKAFSLLTKFDGIRNCDNPPLLLGSGLRPFDPSKLPSIKEPDAALIESTGDEDSVFKAVQEIDVGEGPRLLQSLDAGDWSIALEKNRRKWDRYNLQLPVYVTGHDRISGEWHEIARTIDVSRIGATIGLRRCVRHRVLLHLALPLPMRLRCYRHAEPSYSVYALVRRVGSARAGTRIVAVEFVGQHPPASYFEKPWATYRTKWNGAERRRELREPRPEAISIEYFNESLQRIRQEAAVAENISQNGMRVYVKAAPPDLDWVRVTCVARDFKSLASVCGRYVGKDGFERLCLRFAESAGAA